MGREHPWTQSYSLSTESARDISSTRTAYKCSSDLFFRCLRQNKLLLSIVVFLVIMKISLSIFMSSFVVADCMSRPGHFC